MFVEGRGTLCAAGIFLVICLGFVNFGRTDGHREVKLAVLVPAEKNTSKYFSLHHVRPAIEIAIDKIENGTDYGGDFHFSVTYADTNCSIDKGMNEAIKIYINGSVHVFLGPTCDYAVAPVARQVIYILLCSFRIFKTGITFSTICCVVFVILLSQILYVLCEYLFFYKWCNVLLELEKKCH